MKTIMLLAVMYSTPGTQPTVTIVQSNMTENQCEVMQNRLRESMGEYSLMCATDSAVSSLQLAGF